jgi:chemotaxis protein MotB
MTRRKQPDEHDHRERWLVSYADFVTLLFAFFVVMYSISQVNEGKYRIMSDSLVNAFKPDGRAPPITQPQPSTPRIDLPVPSGAIPQLLMKRGDETQRKLREERLRYIARDVVTALGPLAKEGKVRVTESARGIAVEINASVLFKSAQAVLQPESVRALSAVARVLASTDNAIEIEGHTDIERIATTQFPSNWELSGARASSVVRLFIDSGVAPQRLIAVGFSDTRPVDNNEAPEGRARNRRVTVMIRPDPSDAQSPVSIPDAGQDVEGQARVPDPAVPPN